MYVALTRARRRLYLSLAQSRMLHGQTRYNVASRFFREIPENLMQRINPGFKVRGSMFNDQHSAPEALNLEPGTLNTEHGTRNMGKGTPWRIGQNVTHPKFGAGVIVNAEGRGAEARVQVNFRDSGLKWLMLEYASLTPAG